MDHFNKLFFIVTVIFVFIIRKKDSGYRRSQNNSSGFVFATIFPTASEGNRDAVREVQCVPVSAASLSVNSPCVQEDLRKSKTKCASVNWFVN